MCFRSSSSFVIDGLVELSVTVDVVLLFASFSRRSNPLCQPQWSLFFFKTKKNTRGTQQKNRKEVFRFFSAAISIFFYFDDRYFFISKGAHRAFQKIKTRLDVLFLVYFY